MYNWGKIQSNVDFLHTNRVKQGQYDNSAPCHTIPWMGCYHILTHMSFIIQYWFSHWPVVYARWIYPRTEGIYFLKLIPMVTHIFLSQPSVPGYHMHLRLCSPFHSHLYLVIMRTYASAHPFTAICTWISYAPAPLLTLPQPSVPSCYVHLRLCSPFHSHLYLVIMRTYASAHPFTAICTWLSCAPTPLLTLSQPSVPGYHMHLRLCSPFHSHLLLVSYYMDAIRYAQYLILSVKHYI